MFSIIWTTRGSPADRHGLELDRGNPNPRWRTSASEAIAEPIADSPHGPQTGGEALPRLRLFPSRSRASGKSDIGRARRLLAAGLSYVPHPSFDEPDACDVNLDLSPERGNPELDPARGSRDSDEDASQGNRLPSREREVRLFREMNYLKCLACRIRDRIDPDSPDPVDLDEIERLQAEALKLKNRIVETHMRLVVSVAKRHARVGYGLPERISDGTLALLQAVEGFNFARGNRFSTYATWSIFNALTAHDRREWRRNRSVAQYREVLASRPSESERNEREESRLECKAAVERLLLLLDGRERWVIVNRHGIGGVPEQTLKQIGLDLGISKERVRQIEQRAA